MIERRLLQIAVAIGCLSPLVIGGIGVLRGPAAFGHPPVVPRDLESHFAYLSGIFFATAFAFASCIPGIERKGPRFRLLGALIVAGGLARAFALYRVGAPSTGHLIGLGVELGIVPLLLLWQRRIERLSHRSPLSAVLQTPVRGRVGDHVDPPSLSRSAPSGHDDHA